VVLENFASSFKIGKNRFKVGVNRLISTLYKYAYFLKCFESFRTKWHKSGTNFFLANFL